MSPWTDLIKYIGQYENNNNCMGWHLYIWLLTYDSKIISFHATYLYMKHAHNKPYCFQERKGKKNPKHAISLFAEKENMMIY